MSKDFWGMECVVAPPGSPAQLGLGRSHGDGRKRYAHSAPVAHLNIKTMENGH